jgi:hypothetical protein
MYATPKVEPIEVSLRVNSRWFKSRITRGIFLGALLCICGTTAISSVTAQDLGEIARQARAEQQAKKQSQDQNAPATHVYTNDDLPKHEILTPEDKSRFAAARTADKSKQDANAAMISSAAGRLKISGIAAVRVGTISAAIPVSTLIPVSTPTSARKEEPVAPAIPLNQMPLGDVARYYRAQKQKQVQASAENIPAATPTPNAAAAQVANAAPAPSDSVGATFRLAAHESIQIPASARTAPTVAPTAAPAILLEQMPLGDVARYYRAQKEAQAAVNAKPEAAAKSELSAKSGSPSSSGTAFPMKIGAAPLAVMKPVTKPIAATTANVAVKEPVARIVEPVTPARPKYLRDPFAPPAQMPHRSAAPIQSQIMQAHLPKVAASAVHQVNLPQRTPGVIVPADSGSPRPALAGLVVRVSQIRTVTPRTAATLVLRAALPSATKPSATRALTLVRKPSLPRAAVVPQPRVVRRPVPGRYAAASIQVTSGDTLWSIARRAFGTGTRWQELIARNPGVQDPRKLQVGTQLVLHLHL